MHQRPSSEANSRSASHEIPRLLRNLKVHYGIHEGLPMVPMLSEMNPVHALPLYFRKIHYNIILPPIPRSSKWSPPFRFSDQKSSSHSCYMPRASHPPWHAEEHTLGNSSLYNFLQPFLLMLSHSLQHHVLSHPLCSSFNMRDQVSDPTKCVKGR